MDAERARQLGRYGGLFMLLVQLGVLYEFFAGFEKELEHLPPIGFGLLLTRMSWLRPRPWTTTGLVVIVIGLALLLGATVTGLWIAGASRWRREQPRPARD
jgi:hypothetical protein